MQTPQQSGHQTSSKAPLVKNAADGQLLTSITENIWEVNAPLKLPGLRMTHRMTVLRLQSGGLLIHSPVQYTRALRDAILALGSPRWFVAPSRFHDMYWLEWFGAFPQARFVTVPGMREEHPELPFAEVFSDRSNFWDGELLPLPVRGMPRINEFVFLHPASRTLILADLVFNLNADAQNALGRFFLRLNGLYRKPGISRIFRSFVRDKTAFRESLQEILSHDFDRMIIGHGPNLGGRPILDQAARQAGII
jgi:hypothetical protein